MKNHKLRVIGGHLKSRQIVFPAINNIGLRPTPDRVRETLFNWLGHKVDNAIVLDAFAGSGLLGIEALSRGAKHATFVEKHRKVASSLYQHLVSLNQIQNAKVLSQAFCSKAVSALPGTQYDIIFLDPPFHHGFLLPALKLIMDHQLLTSTGIIYFEIEKAFDLTQIPDYWSIEKQKQAGDVLFGLLYPKECHC